MTYAKELIQYLEANPHRTKVYMNKDGGWLLHPRSSFPIEVSRDEILKEKTVTEKTETETKTKPTKK